MRETVVVSDHFHIGPLSGRVEEFNLVRTSSLIPTLQALINESMEPIIIACFAGLDEFAAVLSLMESFPPLRVECVSHLFTDDPDKSVPIDNPRVAGIHASSLEQADFGFAAHKALSNARCRFFDAFERSTTFARLEDMKHDQDALIGIGRSLQTEKDPDKLLRTILMLSKKITGADAGSIYLVEENDTGKQIRFKYSHTFSKDLPLEEFSLPFNTKSIAGYVAITGSVLNIPDVNKLSGNDPVSFNDSFDKANNYRSISMLVVPMRNHIDQIIGVIQLINSKEDTMLNGDEAFTVRLSTSEDFERKVVPFDGRYEHLMEAVAGQAAIAIENNRMISQIQTQFEEFVKASVTAIESRDPATSGHSFRVAEICTLIARAINESARPPYDNIHFTEMQIKELEYAALLHDFGKVYIDLSIFKKAKKLFPRDLDNLLLKIDYLYRYVELNGIIEENSILNCFDGDERREKVEELKKNKKDLLTHIKSVKEKVLQLNEPTVTEKDPHDILSSICDDIDCIEIRDIDDKPLSVFGDLERTNLIIKRGSLNDDERREIESHVSHTYTFVSKIPWPPEYKNIPEIAIRHHEKLDGTGYPNGERGDAINVQARIMAIADMYDALTATDRPYKRSIPHDKAVDILTKEAEGGKLDMDLVKLFISCNFDKRTA
jgi:HD-GYP domain-containing protein (c-di-GMP phosphodiesterase class II)